MAPIRVGIIGLSATSSWAVKAHLPYLQESPRYEITGVCNSSLATSEAAIKAHGLSCKAYGSIAELAASDDVDLVVCSVRVDRHYECLKPALEAGKNCFVEWPLASNLQQATELLELAEEKGVKTVIGLQGVMSPAIRRVKELVEQGAIGEVLSSHLDLATGLGTAETLDSIAYLNDVELGGNMLTIPFGHLYDSVSYVLGELREVSATLSTQIPQVKVKAADGSVTKTMQRTTADHAAISGLLHSGAQSSAVVHGRGPIKSSPALSWQIEGNKGVIDVRGDSAFAVSMSGGIEMKLYDLATGEESPIEYTEDRPGPPGNIGRVYDAFADGEWYPDWEWAVQRHSWVDAVYKSNESGKRVAYA